MKKLLTALVVVLLSLGADAQQPQTQTDPIFAVNAAFTNGVAPGYWPSKGSGLTLNLGKGTANCMGTLVEYAGGTLTLADAATNYVYLDPGASCTTTSNVSSFGGPIWIAKVTTAGGVITAIDDVRLGFFAPAAGAGSVSSVGANFTGGLISVTGGPITGTGTLAFVLAGTSGGIPYFNSGSTWASSAVLGANLPVVGGGAGNPPTTGTLSGNTTKFVTTTGSIIPGNCTAWDASGNLVDAGATCRVGTTGSPASGNLAAFSGAAAITNGDLSGDVTTSGTLAATLGTQFKITVCEVRIGLPGTASPLLVDDNDRPAVCSNLTGATLTITAVECYANAGHPTVTPIITGGSSTSILTGPITCGAGSFVSGTLNGTPTETSGQSIDANITAAGGVAKYIVIRITETL